MRELKAQKPNYGSWVSMRLIWIPGAVGILLLGLSFAFPILGIGAAYGWCKVP